MKGIFPSWMDSKILNGFHDISGLIIVNKADPIYFTENPLSIVLPEPRATHPEVYRFVEKHIEKYHRIYTFDKILLKFPSARLLLFGTSWIKKEDAIISLITSKAGISFMCGSKKHIIGHRLRNTIYRNQLLLEERSKKILHFWRSGKDEIIPKVSPRGNRILGTSSSAKWDLHRPFHFSIIIENNTQENYFTEKLLDCFLCKTVPIYWGCPNIGDFFSLDGIIVIRGSEIDVLKDLETILRKCDTVKYESMIHAIEYNYQESFKYAYNYSERLKNILEE